MLDLSESRAQIDVIDKEITRLFQKRIDVCRDVAAYKIQNNKKVLDKTRENQKLEALSKLAEDGFKEHGICDLFTQGNLPQASVSDHEGRGRCSAGSI